MKQVFYPKYERLASFSHQLHIIRRILTSQGKLLDVHAIQLFFTLSLYKNSIDILQLTCIIVMSYVLNCALHTIQWSIHISKILLCVTRDIMNMYVNSIEHWNYVYTHTNKLCFDIKIVTICIHCKFAKYTL